MVRVALRFSDAKGKWRVDNLRNLQPETATLPMGIHVDFWPQFLQNHFYRLHCDF